MEDWGKNSQKMKSEGLELFCRSQSQTQLEFLARVSDVKIGDGKFDADQGQETQWVSVIFVSTGAIRLIFKTHYIESDIAQLVSSALGGVKTAVSQEMSKDFIKEFCNVSAGAIKKTFENVSNTGRMSLPIVTRSADNIFFEAKGSPFIFETSWSLEHAKGRICCAVIVEFIDRVALQKILLPAFGAGDAGDVEFL